MPLPTTNLLANWKAGEGITSDANGISQWDDQTAGGYDLTQSTDASKPFERFVDGVKSVYFDSDFMNIPAGLVVDRQDYTVFFVYRKTNGINQMYITLGVQDDLAYHNRIADTVDNALSGNTAGAFRTNSTIEKSDSKQMFYSVSDTVEVTTYMGSESVVWPKNTSGNSAGGGYVGARGGTTFLAVDLDVYEIAIYDKALNSAEQEAVLDYLKDEHSSITINEPTYIIVEGDSLTDASDLDDPWNDKWSSRMSRLCDTQPKLNNIATAGQTLAQMIADTSVFDEYLSINSAYTNRISILWAGTNDIRDSRTTAQITADLDTWVSNASSGGAINVVCTIIDRQSGWPAGGQTTRSEVNTYIKGSLATDIVVDLSSISELSDATNTTYFLADTIHLTIAGQYVVAQAIKDALATAGYVGTAEKKNIVINGAFNSGDDGWTNEPGWTVAGGDLTWTYNGPSTEETAVPTLTDDLVAGQEYELHFEATDVTIEAGGYVRFYIGGELVDVAGDVVYDKDNPLLVTCGEFPQFGFYLLADNQTPTTAATFDNIALWQTEPDGNGGGYRGRQGGGGRYAGTYRSRYK